MRWNLREGRDRFAWHRWFAWHPVPLTQADTSRREGAWLESVERRAEAATEMGYFYRYRAVGAANGGKA